MKKKQEKQENVVWKRYRGSCVQEEGRPRAFPPHDEQMAANREAIRKQEIRRLKKAGCSEADVIAFTTARINMIRESKHA